MSYLASEVRTGKKPEPVASISKRNGFGSFANDVQKVTQAANSGVPMKQLHCWAAKLSRDDSPAGNWNLTTSSRQAREGVGAHAHENRSLAISVQMSRLPVEAAKK
jgi:hypothetical protein